MCLSECGKGSLSFRRYGADKGEGFANLPVSHFCSFASDLFAAEFVRSRGSLSLSYAWWPRWLLRAPGWGRLIRVVVSLPVTCS